MKLLVGSMSINVEETELLSLRSKSGDDTVPSVGFLRLTLTSRVERDNNGINGQMSVIKSNWRTSALVWPGEGRAALGWLVKDNESMNTFLAFKSENQEIKGSLTTSERYPVVMLLIMSIKTNKNSDLVHKRIDFVSPNYLIFVVRKELTCWEEELSVKLKGQT